MPDTFYDLSPVITALLPTYGLGTTWWVYRDGEIVGKTHSNSFLDVDLRPLTSYTYYVMGDAEFDKYTLEGASTHSIISTGPLPGGPKVSSPSSVIFSNSFSLSGSNFDDPYSIHKVQVILDDNGTSIATASLDHGKFVVEIQVDSEGYLVGFNKSLPLSKGAHQLRISVPYCGCSEATVPVVVE